MKKIKILTPLLTIVASSAPFLATACVTNNSQTTILNTNLNAASYVKLTFSTGGDENVSIVGETVCRVKAGKTFGTVYAPAAQHSENKPFKKWAWVSGMPEGKSAGDVVENSDIITSAAVVKPVFGEYDIVFYTSIGHFTKTVDGVTTDIGNTYILHDIEKGIKLGDAFDSSEIDLVTDSSSTLYGLPKITSTEAEKEAIAYEADSTTGITKDTVVNSHLTIQANWGVVEDFTTCDWSYIQEKATAYENGEISAKSLANSFKNVYKDVWDSTDSKWVSTKSPTWYTATGSTDKEKLEDIFVGATKEMTVNSSTHVMRIIGVNHDELVTQPTGKSGVCAAFTFEFKTLLSDSNGISLGAFWHNATSSGGVSFNHTTATIRNNLEGTDSVVWLEAGATSASTTYTKSVLQMISDNITPVQVKKKVATTTATWSTSTDTIKDATEYNAKLFLLSAKEMGYETGTVASSTGYSNINEGSIYTFWEKYTTSASKIHKQVDFNTAGGTTEWSNTSGTIKYSGTVVNYAGNNTAGETTNSSSLWLSSPYIASSNNRAFRIYINGTSNQLRVNTRAFPISPCFCI